jgi:hypothetical protein
MSFSYDPATITTNQIHEVRFLTGQTDPNDYEIEDEEIQYLLDKNAGDVQIAKNEVLKSLLNRASHYYDKTTGEVSEALSQRFKNLQELIDAPPPSEIELVFPTPSCMHAGGLDSEEFALRAKDVTVFQGFNSVDAVPWDVGTGPVYGVSTSCIDDNGKTNSVDQNLDESP